MDIWAACREDVKPIYLAGVVIRVVESQEQVATNSLVDDLQEQVLLEEMLEASKPPLPAHASSLHYLLATPFRYPPLKHGSRFGTRMEPGLFYGARNLEPALAESAYYRLVFWSGMKVPPRSAKFITEHTVFGARFDTCLGLRLQDPPFSRFEKRLIDRESYSDTQLLGGHLRQANIAAFEYLSARDTQRGVNVAVFGGEVFSDTRPAWQQPWLCETTDDVVRFYSQEHGAWNFPRNQFLVSGVLPIPSS